MRPAAFLVLVAVLALAAVAGLLVKHGADLSYELPPGAPTPVRLLALRCYELWPDVRHFDRTSPVFVQLTDSIVADYGLHGRWYRAFVGPAESGRPQLWRPAGPDSVDIVMATFPLGYRFRMPKDSGQVAGRALGNYDVGPPWAGSVQAVTVHCDTLRKLPSAPKRPSNQRLKLSARRRRFGRNAQWRPSFLIAAPAGRSLSATR